MGKRRHDADMPVHDTRDNCRTEALALAEGQAVQAVRHDLHVAPNLVRTMLEKAEGTEALNLYTVCLQPGQEVTPHDHDENVILFYPEGAPEAPVVVDGVQIFPKEGEFLVIPAKTVHWVPKNNSGKRRISVALKYR